MALVISLSLKSSRSSSSSFGENCALRSASSASRCCASKLSGGGNDVCRRGCADPLEGADEPFRETWPGSASLRPPPRCLGNARPEEEGGEAMVEMLVGESVVLCEDKLAIARNVDGSKLRRHSRDCGEAAEIRL